MVTVRDDGHFRCEVCATNHKLRRINMETPRSSTCHHDVIASRKHLPGGGTTSFSAFKKVELDSAWRAHDVEGPLVSSDENTRGPRGGMTGTARDGVLESSVTMADGVAMMVRRLVAGVATRLLGVIGSRSTEGGGDGNGVL